MSFGKQECLPHGPATVSRQPRRPSGRWAATTSTTRKASGQSMGKPLWRAGRQYARMGLVADSISHEGLVRRPRVAPGGRWGNAWRRRVSPLRREHVQEGFRARGDVMIQCPSCQACLKVPAHLSKGKAIRCSRCKKTFRCPAQPPRSQAVATVSVEHAITCQACKGRIRVKAATFPEGKKVRCPKCAAVTVCRRFEAGSAPPLTK